MWQFWILAALGLGTWPHPPDRLAPLHPQYLPQRRRLGLDPRTRRALMTFTALLTVSALFGSQWRLMLPVAVVVALSSRKLPMKSSADQRSAERQQLTVICDLVATCLTAGMPTGAALIAVLNELAPEDATVTIRGSPDVPAAQRRGQWVEARTSPSVASVMPGPVQSPAVAALRAVAALLALGADPGRAWSPADSLSVLAPIAAAARRSTVGGVGLAQAVRDQATVLSVEVAQDLERRAGRAGVMMAAPLGLCFLPAFICLGLAPVIIALLADLGIG